MSKPANIYEQLTRDEGDVPHAYQDSKGYWTIGVGFLIDQRKGGHLPEPVRDFWLRYAVEQRTAALRKRFPWFAKLDSPRQGVLVNMAFNLGLAGLFGFSNTLRYIEQGDYAAAAEEMLDSKWATDVPKRAQRLSKQMRTGQWT